MPPELQINSENVSDHLQKIVLNSVQAHDFLGQRAVHASSSLSRSGRTVHSGVSLLRKRRAATAASSSPEAQRMDELQYKSDEEPSPSAERSGNKFHAPDLSLGTRWPDYLQEIGGAGISSIVAVPVDLSGEALGALNLSAEAPEAFEQEMRLRPASYATQASASFRLAIRLMQQVDTVEDLKSPMASRTRIDVAVGIVMVQNRCSQERAFAIMQRASSSRNMKLRDVATGIVGAVSDEGVETHFNA